jgi:hypothetical protein
MGNVLLNLRPDPEDDLGSVALFFRPISPETGPYTQSIKQHSNVMFIASAVDSSSKGSGYGCQ